MILACHYAYEDGFELVSPFASEQAMLEALKALNRENNSTRVKESAWIPREAYDQWRASRIIVHGPSDYL